MRWSTCLGSIALALFFYVGGCEGIWCFQCNSRTDADCVDMEPNNTRSVHYKECDGSYDGYEPFCRKIVQKIHDRDGLIRVVRKCGWLKHPRLECYRVSNVGHADQVCQCFTDACNGAGSNNPWKAAVLAVTLAGLLITL